MGCSSSTAKEEKTEATKKIDKLLTETAEGENNQVKILLLGAGECGKSTILKQMKILHDNGFTDREKKEKYLDLVHKNTLQAIEMLCNACKELEVPYEKETSKEYAAILTSQSRSPDMNDLVGLHRMIHHMWTIEPAIKRVLERSNEFNLLDSAPYFLNAIDRAENPTFSRDYVPTEQDILRTRLATVGIIETVFWVDKICFRMFDVGGQRGERKKWIHCFENVRAIMFIASLSEYDQVLEEDRTRNRMMESLKLFEGIISLPWFKDTATILFLNKNDLFQQKIKKVPLGAYFPAYVGDTYGGDTHAEGSEEKAVQDAARYELGLVFIKEMYFSKNNNPDKQIYAHVTDATNTGHIAFVWRVTKHVVMQQNLSQAGLLMQ